MVVISSEEDYESSMYGGLALLNALLGYLDSKTWTAKRRIARLAVTTAREGSVLVAGKWRSSWRFYTMPTG